MDYRYLTETKNEFNNFLCGILAPHLYHGIKGMLKYSENVYNQIEIKIKKGSKIENIGLINIFKKTLDGLSNLNNHEIEEEYLRIKNNSGCIDWFDNLVRSVFKSYVLFLTWDPKIGNSKYSDNSIYESIIIKDFIHKCYVISCNYFRDNPEIFINKSNKKEVFDILKMCIDMSIKKSLPYNQIIQEYLNIEFDKSNDTNSKEIENIKNMVYNMMNDRKYGTRPEINNLIIDESSKDEFVNLEDPEYKRVQLENFINQEKINQYNKNLSKITSENNSEKSNDNKLLALKKSYANIDNKILNSTSSITSENENNEDNNDNDNNKDNNSNIKLKNNYFNSQSLNNESNSKELNNNESNNNESNNNESNNTSSEIDNKSNKKELNDNFTSTNLSRVEIKNKEINNIINNKKINEELLETSISENNKKSNVELSSTSEMNNSKNSIIEILSTPPPIRQKLQDRMNDIFELGKVINNKKNVKVIKGKNNILSEKFDQVESFYDDMIKI